MYNFAIEPSGRISFLSDAMDRYIYFEVPNGIDEDPLNFPFPAASETVIMKGSIPVIPRYENDPISDGVRCVEQLCNISAGTTILDYLNMVYSNLVGRDEEKKNLDETSSRIIWYIYRYLYKYMKLFNAQTSTDHEKGVYFLLLTISAFYSYYGLESH